MVTAMSPDRLRPTRLTRLLAAPLLALQAVAGGAVTLADASEPLTAQSHIEAQRASTCPVLHDALRCALCHYAGTRVALPATTVTAPAEPVRVVAPRLDYVSDVATAVRYTAPPRAPPIS
jgi:hypothetical protein